MFTKLSNRDAYGYPLKFRSAEEAELIGFAPPSADELFAWYKADALTLNDNDKVASWLDSSGNGNTLTQTTEADKPTFKTDIVNSQPAVLFSASQAMSMAKDISGSSAFSFVSVTKPVASQNQHVYLGTNQGSGGTRWNFGRGSHSSYGYGQVGSAAQLNLGNDSTGLTWISRIGTYDKSNWHFYDNDSASADKTKSDTSFPTSATTWTIGAENVNGMYGMNGYIAEIFMYKKVLTSTERSKIYTYLNEKYSLTA